MSVADPNQSARSQAEIHVESLIARNAEYNRATFTESSGDEVLSIGVIGAGFMGTSIAEAAIEHGIPVTIMDQDAQALVAAEERLQKAVESSEPFVTTTHELKEVAQCDLIVESVVEDPFVKREIFAALETHCPENTIITTNTSTLPIEKFSNGLSRADQFCGFHFFPPFGLQPMMEIIPGSPTSQQTISNLVALTDRMNRIPLVVPDGRGFLVNRLLGAYMCGTMRLMMSGIDLPRIDRVSESFGMVVGGARIYDEIGLDVALHCAVSMGTDRESFRVHTPPLARLYKKKQLGRKTGRGLYLYGDENEGQLNPDAVELFKKHATTDVELTDEQLNDVIGLAMVNEATSLLEEGRARDAGHIDLAIMFGIGFPMARGGVLRWADEIGADRIVEMLEPLAYLGNHLKPTKLLTEVAKNGGRFYDIATDQAPTLVPSAS